MRESILVIAKSIAGSIGRAQSRTYLGVLGKRRNKVRLMTLRPALPLLVQARRLASFALRDKKEVA